MIKNIHVPRIFIIALSALIFSTSLMPFADAATANGESATIGISPVSKKYEFEAGSTMTDSITVINSGQASYTFKMSAEPYSIKNTAYEPDYLTVKKNTDLEGWINFEKNTHTLAPGESKQVKYVIAVPENATPGGHYAVIFAETQPSGTDSEQAALRQKTRVGTVVYATVKGDYKMGGEFKGIRTPALQFRSPLTTELDVENTGSSDFAVDTVYAVSDLFGNRKFTETKQYQMLPQTERKIQLKWENSPGFGLYQVTVSAKFLDKQTSSTSYVLMAPIAFYMVFALALLVSVIFFLQKRRSA